MTTATVTRAMSLSVGVIFTVITVGVITVGIRLRLWFGGRLELLDFWLFVHGASIIV